MSINAELLEILACPACRGELSILPGNGQEGCLEEPEGLLCPACRVVYPVRDSIPVMLKEEAVPKAEWDGGAR